MSAPTYQYHAEGSAGGNSLAILFHGTGGDERQFVPLARDLMPGAAILAPRGDVSEHGALRFFRREGPGRYDMADLARRTEAMGTFLQDRIAAAGPARVVGLGYSNGANILASVLFERPELFDEAVLMHPLIPWDPTPKPQRARILITAGERDPMGPPEETRRLADWFAANGAATETVWHPGGHDVAPSELSAIARFLHPEPDRRRA